MQEVAGCSTGARAQSKERAALGAGQAAARAEQPVAVFTMPMPPSVNKAYRNTARGRAKTRETEDWQGYALWHIRAQRPRPIEGPVVVVFGFERTSRAADADNRHKLAQDVLEKAGIITNDNLVIGYAGAWLPAQNGLCHVAVIPAQRVTLEFLPSSDGSVGGWIVKEPQLNMETANDGDLA